MVADDFNARIGTLNCDVMPYVCNNNIRRSISDVTLNDRGKKLV